MGTPDPAASAASAITAAFGGYHADFKAVTRRAKRRFERRDWAGAQKDAVERLDLYKRAVDRVVAAFESLLGGRLRDKSLWTAVRAAHARLVAGAVDRELAESFFNSVTRRILITVGIDPTIDYVFTVPPESAPVAPFYRRTPRRGSTAGLLREVVLAHPFGAPYEDLDRDCRLAAARVDAHLAGRTLLAAEVLDAVFYRDAGAYLVGRLVTSAGPVPLVLSLRHRPDGVVIDAVLLTPDDVSVVFSFARSYFHVEVDRPREFAEFLRSVMPLKPLAEIYISIGYNKHGKTELYRDLYRHLEATRDRFEAARGEKGLVMLVFTLPQYDVVFKVIRDRFGYTKKSTRRTVMERYHLVFQHDRVGRLVDAQEFEHLEFDRDRFAPPLLADLLENAGETVSVAGDKVVIKHLYTERRVTPLNLYVREASPADAAEAVVDYGRAVKDLAAVNIFPGDFLLKNFGVTRHGRVVCYDYDELCFLSDCHIREVPQAADDADELEAEPWYYVAENDFFPAEFRTYLGVGEALKEVFLKHHADLFGTAFWKEMQRRLAAEEIADILPYKPDRRLRP